MHPFKNLKILIAQAFEKSYYDTEKIHLYGKTVRDDRPFQGLIPNYFHISIVRVKFAEFCFFRVHSNQAVEKP